MKDGYIKSLDDKVTVYIPGLKGSAYDDVSVRQLLTMTSGGTMNMKPSSKPPKKLDDPTPPGPGVEYEWYKEAERGTPGRDGEQHSEGLDSRRRVAVGNLPGDRSRVHVVGGDAAVRRLQQAQERVHADGLVAGPEVRDRPERVRADEHAPLRPPQRDLGPEAGAEDGEELEGRTGQRGWNDVQGHARVIAHVEAQVVARL